MAGTFITDVLTNVDTIVVGSTATIWGDLVGAYGGAIAACFILYVAIYGWALWYGWVEGTMREAFTYVLRGAFVYALTLSWGNFSELLYNAYYLGADQMSGVIAGGMSAGEGLDKILNEGVTAGGELITASGWGSMGVMFIGLVVVILTALVCSIAMFLLIIAKAAVGVLLAVGALFIVFYLFKATRGYTNSWLGALLNYALVGVLTMVVLKFMLVLMQDYTTELVAILHKEGTGVTINDILGFIVMMIAMMAMLFQVMPMAASLAGGAALSDGGVLGRAGRASRSTANSFGHYAGKGLGHAGLGLGRGVGRGGRAIYRHWRPNKAGA
jgi:type IV secretion system protein VirB6